MESDQEYQTLAQEKQKIRNYVNCIGTDLDEYSVTMLLSKQQFVIKDWNVEVLTRKETCGSVPAKEVQGGYPRQKGFTRKDTI